VRELEFLPEDYLRARFQRRIGFIRSWLLLAIGLVMVLYSFQMGMWVRESRAELQALRGTGSAVEPDVKKVRQLREEARGYNHRITYSQRLQPGILMSDVLADIVASLPEAVVLTELDVQSPADTCAATATLRLEGMAEGEQDVTRTVAGLDDLPRFSRTLLVESKLAAGATGGSRTFVIEANIMSNDRAPKE